MPMEGLVVLLLVLVVGIVVFLVFREFFCWYWKVNERLDEQRKNNAMHDGTNQLLRALIEAQGITDPAERARFVERLWTQ